MKKILFSLVFFLLVFFNNIFAQNITYIFIGKGNWSDSVNWLNRLVPPNVLPAGSAIEIMPVDNLNCILDIPQIISRGAQLTIGTNKYFYIVSGFVNQNSKDDFKLSVEDVEHLDSSGAPNPALDQMTGVDGLPLGIKDELVKKLLTYAQELSDQKITVPHPAGNSTEPYHTGFAYSCGNSSGNKDLSHRHMPDEGDSLHRAYAVYGTDCTGFLYNLLKHAGITLDPVPTVAGFETSLKIALTNNSTYKNIKVKNMGYLPGTELKSGDFIVWKEKGHNGIICNLNNLQQIIFNSNGQPNPMTHLGWKIKPGLNPPTAGTRRTPDEEQQLNLEINRGVHPLAGERIAKDSYWGTEYEILRLEEDSTFTDPRDGQVYTFKHFGSQVWMTQNLNYAAAGWCYDNYLPNGSIYGRLYNWGEAITLAPPGWHLPSNSEWNALGGAGADMKATTLWTAPNTGATNRSGFTGLPGGYRISNGVFGGIGRGAYWWSSTEYFITGHSYMSYYYNLVNYSGGIYYHYDDKPMGMSIRYVRD